MLATNSTHSKPRPGPPGPADGQRRRHGPAALADQGRLRAAVRHQLHELVRRLLPLLERTADPRIVVLTSAAFRAVPIAFDDLKTTQDNFKLMGGIMRYGQSKLADLLLAKELACRLPFGYSAN